MTLAASNFFFGLLPVLIPQVPLSSRHVSDSYRAGIVLTRDPKGASPISSPGGVGEFPHLHIYVYIYIYLSLSLSLCEYSHIESKLLRATAAVESNICPQELRLLLLQKLFDHCCWSLGSRCAMKRSDLPRGGLESPLRRAKCCKSAAWVASTGSDQMKRFGSSCWMLCRMC